MVGGRLDWEGGGERSRFHSPSVWAVIFCHLSIPQPCTHFKWIRNNLLPISFTLPFEEIARLFVARGKERRKVWDWLIQFWGHQGVCQHQINSQIFFPPCYAVNKPSPPWCVHRLKAKLAISLDTIKVMASLLSNPVYLLRSYTNMRKQMQSLKKRTG